MINKNVLLPAATLAVLCCSVAAGQAQRVKPPSVAASPAPGDRVKGKATWSRVGCYTCHGYAAQGAEMSGPKLSGRGFTLPIFSAMVRKPRNLMPPYSKQMVSDAELNDILAYVNSIDTRPKR